MAGGFVEIFGGLNGSLYGIFSLKGFMDDGERVNDGESVHA